MRLAANLIAILLILFSCSSTKQSKRTREEELRHLEETYDMNKLARLSKSMTPEDAKQASGDFSSVDNPRAQAVFPQSSSSCEISVVAVSAHIFLSEFDRYLVLKKGGERVALEKLSPDSGGGAFSNLYSRSEFSYLLIDANGYWFDIDTTMCTIKVEGFMWEEEPAGEYLGCFDNTEGEFAFVPKEEMQERNPYMVKDPDRRE